MTNPLRKEVTSAIRSFVLQHARRVNWPALLFCCAPLLVFLLVICVLKVNPFRWVPLWSDEVGWYVQVSSAVKFGAPLGYTGYNETHAAVGTFGPWGAFLVCGMAVFGKIFGWHNYSPLLMNVAYWMLANLAFFLFTRPKAATLIKLAVLNFILFLSVQYMFTGMSECTRFSMAIVLAGLFYYLLQDENKGRRGYLIVLGAIAPILLFLFINAYILFAFLLPFYGYVWFKYLKPGRCRALVFLSFVVLLPILFFLVCYFIQVKTTAPFPQSAAGACLNQPNLAAFFKALKATVRANLRTADFSFIFRNPLLEYGCVSSYLFFYYCLAIVVWVRLVATLVVSRRLHLLVFLIASALSVFVIAFLALYSTRSSWTYIRGLNVAFVFSMYLVCMLDWPKSHLALFGLMFMQFFPFATVIKGDMALRYSERSFYGGGYAFLKGYSAVFSDKLVPVQSTDPWDNTVACYGRPTNHGCAFPAGISWNYIMDGHAVSKPRYIVTGSNSKQVFKGYRRTYIDDQICIFEKVGEGVK